MKRTWPVHPIFFAAYPILSLYSRNTSLFPLADLRRPLEITIFGVIVVWLLFAAIFRSADRAATVASVSVLSFFSYGPIFDVLKDKTGRGLIDPPDRFYYWVPVCLLLLILACWPWKKVAMLRSGLNAASIFLVAVTILPILLAFSKRDGGGATGSTTSSIKLKGPAPDIFYVILDGYGRHDAILKDMGFDNSEFVDGLRKRGFYIADSAHSNYCQTELSLTSSLNMGFLPDVVPSFSEENQDRAVLDGLIDRNRVSQILRGFGYRYVAVTSGFPAVHPDSADLLIAASKGNSLFEAAVLARTPIDGAGRVQESQYVSRRDNLVSAITDIGSLGAPVAQPRFIFDHVLAPHPPFVFGPNGEAKRPNRSFAIVDGSHFYQNGGTPAEYRRDWPNQAKTVGRLVLAALDELMAKETIPPIVIIQGDHGPKMRYDQEELKQTDVNEVFPILNAYFVPSSVRSQLYSGISPVNSFRAVLREIFGQNLPNLPDRSWYTSWTYPFRLQEVTSRLVAGN